MNPISEPETTHWSVALIISVCVNLLLAGIIAMAVFRFAFHPPGGGEAHHPQPWPMPAVNAPVGQLERQQVRQLMSPRLLMRLAPDKAQAVHALMKAHHDEMDRLRNASIEARREVVRLYTVEPFDRAALEQALAKMQAADAALEIAAVKATAESSVVLTPEERKAVIAWQPPRGPHGGGGKDWQAPLGPSGKPIYDQPPVPIAH